MDGPRSPGGEKYSSLIDMELKDASCLFLVLFLCVARAQARVLCRVFFGFSVLSSSCVLRAMFADIVS